MGHMPKFLTDEARIINKIKRHDGCWLWTGGTASGGYGQLRLADGTRMLAHRYSYTLFVAPIPEGKIVVNTCEQRLCVYPKHLRLEQDAATSIRGTSNGNAKLDEEQVVRIKRRRLAGESLRSIAEEFEVDPSTVSYIANGQIWSHVKV